MRAGLCLGIAAFRLQQKKGVAHRRERIAQLVRERGQELVLAPVDDAQRLLGAAALIDLALEIGQHAVHRVGEHADLVLGGLARAHREVAVLDHAARGVGDAQDRRGDRALQPCREHQRGGFGPG